MNELRFDGQSVIVTGGGRGIGRCHALLLAARGARVIVADFGGLLDGSGRSKEPADEVVKEIKAAGGEAVTCHASVADTAGAESIVQTALESFGRIDAIINNAGIIEQELFEDLPLEHFERMNQVNYMGTLYVIRAAWPHLCAAKYGRIVNTCSEAMLGINTKTTGYSGSKGGVLGLTRSLASEAAQRGIRVNALMPRAKSRMFDADAMSKSFGVPAEQLAPYVDQFPPELVSPVAAYLAHESCQLNGEVLVAGGGQVQRLGIVLSTGILAPDLSPEQVAAQLDMLMDLKDAQPVQIGAYVSLAE